MDRRSWLWRRKSSSEKSPGETESSGSLSSERYSDEQEVLRSSPAMSSPNHVRSPEISSKDSGGEVVKNLNEKLSAALLSVSLKEDLVKQHAQVAEEAVLGWEKAEEEVLSLKQQLEAAKRRNSSLEDQIGHLDEALKECVRQLRQSREEQEQKVKDVITNTSLKWESEKCELQIQIAELQSQMEAKAETHTSSDSELHSKVEVLEKENSDLRAKIITVTEDLRLRAIEIELSTKAAETASKQHLESIKKVAKLEAECRRLHTAARKSSLPNDHKLFSNSLFVESLSDSQSDTGDRSIVVDNELSRSDSWASALIAELDQFKNEKTTARNLNSSVEMDLFNDFLEMEKLAALPEIDHESSSFTLEVDWNSPIVRDTSPRSQLDTVRKQMIELEEKIKKMEIEKTNLAVSLEKACNELDISNNKLEFAECKVVELQRLLNSVNGEKHDLQMEVETAETKRIEMELQHQLAHKEIEKLQITISSLQGKVVDEKTMTEEFAERCQNMDALEAKSKEMVLELEAAHSENAKLQGTVTLLENRVQEEKELSSCKSQEMYSLEAKKVELEWQVKSANLELNMLHEKLSLSENKVKDMETKGRELEYQLNSADLELFTLREKVQILEVKIEDEMLLSAESAANLEASEAKRKGLALQLDLSQTEVRSLQNQLGVLEKQVQDEKACSETLAVKCQALLNEMCNKKKSQEEHQGSASSNSSFKIRQEKDIAAAAGKLAECQRTIASLNKQLKSLATLDDFMIETEESKAAGDPIEHIGKLRLLHSNGSTEEINSPWALSNGRR